MDQTRTAARHRDGGAASEFEAAIHAIGPPPEIREESHPLIAHSQDRLVAALYQYFAQIRMGAILGDLAHVVEKLFFGIGVKVADRYFLVRQIGGIRARDASHLLPSSTIKVVLRRPTYLRSFLLDALKLTPLRVRRAMHEFQTVDSQD